MTAENRQLNSQWQSNNNYCLWWITRGLKLYKYIYCSVKDSTSEQLVGLQVVAVWTIQTLQAPIDNGINDEQSEFMGRGTCRNYTLYWTNIVTTITSTTTRTSTTSTTSTTTTTTTNWRSAGDTFIRFYVHIIQNVAALSAAFQLESCQCLHRRC